MGTQLLATAPLNLPFLIFFLSCLLRSTGLCDPFLLVFALHFCMVLILPSAVYSSYLQIISFRKDAMNPRLLLAFKNDDFSTDSRLQTDVNSHRGDENVTGGSFHLGCCAGVSCGPPLHVANGVVRGAVFQFGDVAVYSCFGGYAMQGIGRSRCLENGTWTPPPTCRGRASMTDRREPLSLFFSLSPPPSNFICSALLLTFIKYILLTWMCSSSSSIARRRW